MKKKYENGSRIENTCVKNNDGEDIRNERQPDFDFYSARDIILPEIAKSILPKIIGTELN